MELIKGEIIANRKYGENLYKLEVFSPYICRNSSGGQFINILCRDENVLDPLLRRPFSIYEVDKDFSVFSILFLVRGKGTLFLSGLQKGDTLNFMGPLGNGFKPGSNQSKFVLVGGGIGVAPLNVIAKDLIETGKNVMFIAGFKDETFYMWQRDIAKIVKNFMVFTENGSLGEKGLPADYIRANISVFKGFSFIACGPKEMLRTLQKMFTGKHIRVFSIMEENMACGIGACHGCVVKVRAKNKGFEYKKVCSDGPVFDLMEVIFD